MSALLDTLKMTTITIPDFATISVARDMSNEEILDFLKKTNELRAELEVYYDALDAAEGLDDGPQYTES